MPVWVRYSYNFATPASHDKLLPRHQQANLPPAGVSKRGTFRHHMNSGSRCMMPSAIYSDCKHVLSGLASAFSFLLLLRKELDAMLGPVGVNNSMLRMQECMAKCWDWKHLLKSDPAAQHVASFMWLGLEWNTVAPLGNDFGLVMFSSDFRLFDAKSQSVMLGFGFGPVN